MAKLYYCEVCCKHHLDNQLCQSVVQNGTVSGLALATLLGLTACGDKPSEVETSALYGVEVVDTAYWDDDGDGFSLADGDCDDDNADVNPDAEETPGDGVDSNCNGEDDT